MFAKISIAAAFVVIGSSAAAFELRSQDAFTPRYCTAEELDGSSSGPLKGNISFTQPEKALHDAKVAEAVGYARSCARSALEYQQEFGLVQSHFGFSPYVGSNSQSYLPEEIGYVSEQLTPSQRLSLSEKMIPVSCVGVALKCLEDGFVKSGLGDIWTKIHKFRCANQSRGSAIQHALWKLGWETVYWNNGEQETGRLKVSSGKYTYGILDVNVDFPEEFPDTSKPVPSGLDNVQFGFGAAEDGFHVFIATTNDAGEFVTIEGSRGAGPVLVEDIASGESYAAYYQNPPGTSGVMTNYTDGIIAVPPR